MKGGQLAQQLAGPFVVRVGGLDSHFDDLIAALAGARIHNALFAQPEALAVFRALRNLQ